MKVSFAPLEPDAVAFLVAMTGIDYSAASFQPPHWFCACARGADGAIMGVLACEFERPWEVQFNTAIVDPRCMSRRLLRAIFRALFSQAVRIVANVDPMNGRAVTQMQRLGFQIEGYCRRGLDGQRDSLLYGMLEDDCRFLKVSRETLKKRRHEKPESAGSLRHR